MNGPSKGFLTPSQLAILALLGLIAAGTFLLSLPISHADGARLTVFDAFFTATSALCVTGLVVVDTGSAFSFFGTAVILVLFQIGGMGMLLWSSTMIVLLGGQLGLRHRLLMKEQLPGMSMAGAGRLALNVMGFVLAVEVLGALLLWLCWRERIPGLKGIYYAFFHSASAFCNAGFALWPDSLAQDVGNIGVNLVIVSLVVFGGLGYAVVRDVYWSATGRKSRMSIHSRLVLVFSAILTLGGASLFFLFESPHGGILHQRSGLEQILIPLFQAGGRTAGLSTINMADLRPETLQLMMALMFIGGSPGSTAGGLKTTTFAILVLAAWSQIRGREDVEAFGRRLTPSLVMQALAEPDGVRLHHERGGSRPLRAGPVRDHFGTGHRRLVYRHHGAAFHLLQTLDLPGHGRGAGRPPHPGHEPFKTEPPLSHSLSRRRRSDWITR